MKHPVPGTNSLRPPSPTASPALTFDSSLLAGQLAPSSIAMYARDFRAYLDYATTAEAATQPVTLARWRTYLAQETDKSPNTINRMLSAVKRIMREAATQGHLPSETADAFNQVAGVKAAALKDRVKTNARTRIAPEAMRDICETPETDRLIGLRDTALLATLAGSGLRVTELAGLTTGQIEARPSGPHATAEIRNSYIVRVRGKNDVEYRDAPLSREAYSHIEAWLAARPVRSEYIFTAFDGRGRRLTARPLSSVAVWKIVRKYALAAGIDDVKPHDFRRFVGTQLAQRDLRQAQRALGHKRLETTARHYILDELEPGLTDDLY